MTCGEAMARTDWGHGLGELARDVMRVLFVYALVLQTLAPLALARAETRDGLSDHATLCSTMADVGVTDPANTPVRVVHDCLACCVGSVAATLAPPIELSEPTGFSRLRELHAPRAFARLALAGGPPPQRAPPDLA